LDLILVIDDEAYEAVMRGRLVLIGSGVSLVAGFTGEHVGEPRPIVTFVGPGLLRIDFQFIRASDFAERIAPEESRTLQATPCRHDRHEAGEARVAALAGSGPHFDRHARWMTHPPHPWQDISPPT
jgi:hypothetical protein